MLILLRSCDLAKSWHSGIRKVLTQLRSNGRVLLCPLTKGPSSSICGLFSSPEDHSSSPGPAILVDFQFLHQLVLVLFCALVKVYLLSSGCTYPTLTCKLLSCLHTPMLHSLRFCDLACSRLSGIHSKGTQLRSNERFLFGVLVCIRH